MASMNSDIRLRSRNTGRVALAVISAALLALVLSVGISLLPFTAHASTTHDHDFSGDDSGNHSGNDNGGDNGKHDGDDHHDADSEENTYALCHNHVDDDSNGKIDLKDPGCANVSNDIPELYNQSIVTNENVATTTTLSGTDADDDLLYFEVTDAPAHGTLSGLDTNVSYTLEAMPVITYTPDAGFVGTDSFNLKVNDGLAGEKDIVGQIATIKVTVNAPIVVLNPACTTAPTSTVVDVTQQITNDPDSGFFGNWALDAFTRHITIWQNQDDTSGGVTYCAKADDTGTFTTTGPKSPNSNVDLVSGISGTMSGSTGVMTIKGAFAPQWATSGSAPAQDCSVAGTGCDQGLTTKWVDNYFATTSPLSFDYPNWGWTYNACGHGTWVNAAAGSSGDILSAGNDCAHSSNGGSNGGGSNNPAPADAGSGGGGGGGGAVASGPLSIGFVNTNPSVGGEVLGTSTEATSSDDNASASCPLYLTGFLKQGMSGDEVSKLQTFLNAQMKAGLPVTGYFGPLTFEAVKNFQLSHWDEVLAPWSKFGLGDHTPTGYVYKTTQRAINLVECNNAIEIPQPQLP